jgi:hypothetical protein
VRITYTRDHFQRAYIIQIVIDDPDIIGLPLAVNINPTTFLSLSTQLLYLATVVKELEAASDREEEQNMFDADVPDEDLSDEEEEVEEEEEETEDSEYPDTEGEDIAEGELDEDEEEEEDIEDEEEESEDDSITQSEGEED